MADQTVTVFGVNNQYEPGSPEWWFQRLACGLRDRREGRDGGKTWNRDLREPTRVRPGLERLHDYLVGDPPLVGFAEEWGETFREICRLGRLNMAENIVNAKSARMTLRGFRTAAARDDLGDDKARAIMRGAQLKVKAPEIHGFMLWGSVGYGMVVPPRSDGTIPPITSEDPRYTITVSDPETGRPMAGLKMYRDDWDYSYVAHLYIVVDKITERTLHFPLRKQTRYPVAYTSSRMADGWELTDTVATLPRFPIIAFSNRGGRGEYEYHLDTLDRINDQVMNKLVIAKVQAFRQMAIKGLPDKTTEIDPETGAITEVDIDYSGAFVAAPGSLWQIPDGAELWESQPTDLGPLRLAIKDDLQQLAAATGTSLPSMTPDAASGSAEGASLMREQEVFATESVIAHADVAWAELMSVAFAFMGDKARADVSQIEPMWGPTERYTLTEKTAAASQAQTTLPRPAIWTDIYQYDPTDVPRLRLQQGAELMTQATQNGASGAPPVTFLPPSQAAPSVPPPPVPDGG